jgi:hypothetical protein
MDAKIDTTLRQWCASCMAATLTRICVAPPNLCCARCCPPGLCREDEDEDE